MNAFIQQGRIKFIKSDSNGIYNVTEVCTSNKCCSFELSIHQRILKKLYHGFHKSISNKNYFQHIRMISEGSCDTEDCSNDAENSALITGINYIFKYITIEISYFEW